MRNRWWPRAVVILIPVVLVLGFLVSEARAYHYTIKARVNLRAGPGLGYKVLQRLESNQSLHLVARQGNWLRVRTLAGRTGFVRRDMVSDLWIKVHKKERRLWVMRGRREVAWFRVALCPFNPLGDKVKQGDGGTPEGRFFICQATAAPRQAKYGARSLRLSYPNREDARRGLAAGLINRSQYRRIVAAIDAGVTPPQNTALGGSIRIHGGGSARHWTLGCLALDDRDVIRLFRLVRVGTRVEIYRSQAQERKLSQAGYLNRLILAGAKAQLVKPALYTQRAMGVIALKYPGGDFSKSEAVCTDIVIRSLRAAGLDLQALVHEDVLRHPKRYRRVIRPNPNIDHRRVRNLLVFLQYHAQVMDPRKNDFRPGDVVVMDTGIPKVSVCDHVGIVGDIRDPEGDLEAINIWAPGLRTASMAILGKSYPKVVGHFRLTHPFDYH